MTCTGLRGGLAAGRARGAAGAGFGERLLPAAQQSRSREGWLVLLLQEMRESRHLLLQGDNLGSARRLATRAGRGAPSAALAVRRERAPGAEGVRLR